MTKIVRRGYLPTDEKEFNQESVQKLNQAAKDLYYLLNQGYAIKGASAFVGNHYLLSERQRLALTRAVSAQKNIEARKKKEIIKLPEHSTLHIDGFNTIITLEIALSNSLLLKCMDGTIRDLAGLRGNYRIIDKTETAIHLIGSMLEKCKVEKAVFYLDAPVSNSGNLKGCIAQVLEKFPFCVEIEVINNVDSVLEKLENVVTSDAIILDQCFSWFNLNGIVMEEKRYSYVNFNGQFLDDCEL